MKYPKACVRLSNQYYTDWFDTPSGVKQGDCFSATAFSLFINDLALEIKLLNRGVLVNSKIISILMYADDVVVLSETENNLQVMLNTINTWCNKWKLLINEAKSNVIHFRPKGKLKSKIQFKIGDKDLGYDTKYKYLGVTFHENLDFSMHKNILSKSGTRALGSIINKYKLNKDMPFKMYGKLFHSCVIPILDYGSEVWGMYKCSEVEKVQNTGARVFLGVNRFTPILSIQGDIGWQVCQTRIELNMLRYWNRLLKMDDNRICKHLFLWDHSLAYNNWSYYMKDIFEKINCTVFDERKSCNISDCGEKLSISDNQEWKNKLSYKPKLRTYKQCNKRVENYIKMNLTCKERSMFKLGSTTDGRITITYRNWEIQKYSCRSKILFCM